MPVSLRLKVQTPTSPGMGPGVSCYQELRAQPFPFGLPCAGRAMHEDTNKGLPPLTEGGLGIFLLFVYTNTSVESVPLVTSLVFHVRDCSRNSSPANPLPWSGVWAMTVGSPSNQCCSMDPFLTEVSLLTGLLPDHKSFISGDR